MAYRDHYDLKFHPNSIIIEGFNDWYRFQSNIHFTSRRGQLADILDRTFFPIFTKVTSPTRQIDSLYATIRFVDSSKRMKYRGSYLILMYEKQTLLIHLTAESYTALFPSTSCSI
ncbi:hypothetical protein C8Q75DRAFT_264721 [Abortiporus biennis]|nr:hypothetical protein C8Q75DRAFT_264721 [Abortiporus biennis]